MWHWFICNVVLGLLLRGEGCFVYYNSQKTRGPGVLVVLICCLLVLLRNVSQDILKVVVSVLKPFQNGVIKKKTLDVYEINK